MVQAFQLLRGTCTYCHRFLVGEVQVRSSPLSAFKILRTDAGMTRAQLLKQIARLTLLEHGLVTHALELDAHFQGPAPASKSKSAAAAKARAAAAADNVEDAEQGESTDETADEFRARLDAFVQGALRAAKKGKGVGLEHHGRDEYKESGTAFDVRRKVIAQFLKTLGAKRRCEHCGA